MRAWMFLCLAALACTGGVVAPGDHDFGEVPAGQPASSTLTLTHSGSGAVSLELRIEAGDFAVSPAAARLEPGGEGAITVTFTPTALGPRHGTLLISGGAAETRVALTGIGVGAQLGVSHELLNLGSLPLIIGAPDAFPAQLTLTNSGTRGTALQLQSPLVDSAEVCVGALVAGACQPWVAPAPLAPGDTVVLPLVVMPTQAGQRVWKLTLRSDDPLSPERVVDVVARVEAHAPCELEAPASVSSLQGAVAIELRNRGTSTCFFRDRSVEVMPVGGAGFFDPAPARLEPGARARHWLRVTPAISRAWGTARLRFAGGVAVEVPFSFDVPPSECLVVSPTTVDFGTVTSNCNSSDRSVVLYNVCSASLQVTGATVSAPEFVLTSTSLGEVEPGGHRVLRVKFRPATPGSSQGALLVSATEGGRSLLQAVALQGRGQGAAVTEDTYQVPVLPKADLLVLVDSSPSFGPKRAAVRENLWRVLNQVDPSCLDLQFAFATADGADGGAALLSDDAGTNVFSSATAGDVDRALAAFDALPFGSEEEACAGPAASLLSGNPGLLRPTAGLSVLCVTDALEQTPNVASALSTVAALQPRFSWSVVGPFSAVCAVEAPDDGVHAGLVAASSGVSADICSPTWSAEFQLTATHCGGGRRVFSLSFSPWDGQLEVLLNGVTTPAVDALGQTVWSYEPPNNVRFEVPPPPGSVITFRYTPNLCQ
ncbi:MAG: choice-of-anchor D domain-containing protein [Archangium sp.]|nr:choice-of-anchor D domain-containing protein [Archangium sp.]